MPSGGRRAEAGRRLGDVDKKPRVGSAHDRAFQEMAKAYNGEYLITNPKTRKYDGLERQFLDEVWRLEEVPLHLRMIALRMLFDYFGVPEVKKVEGRDASEALIDAINRLRFDEEEPHEGELIPPVPTPTSRPASPPPVKQSVTDVPTSGQASITVAAPAPTPPAAEPGPDMMEVHFPTRSGVITKLVPRILRVP